jgi:hypothetical protein
VAAELAGGQHVSAALEDPDIDPADLKRVDQRC